MRHIIYLLCALMLVACSSSPRHKSSNQTKPSSHTVHQMRMRAESRATPSARRVLAMSRKMVDSKKILPGGCWDYVDAVFTRAGFPRKVRKHVFNGKYPRGPFVNVNQIREGDWLYFINHSYRDIQHSSLFIGWTNKAKKQGLMLSYAGEGRLEPARYLVYDLRHVYKIVRVN